MDDDPGVRRFLAESLNLCGCAVFMAASGREACAASAEAIDLLIVDLMMPEMDGVETVRRMRVRLPDIPVLYLTGHANALFKRHRTFWANEAYLDKPCTVDALCEAASLVLDGNTSSISPRSA